MTAVRVSPRRRRSTGAAGRESIHRADRLHAAIFLTPWAIGVVWLMAAPVVLAVYWSFTNYDLLTPPKWVGFANYSGLFHNSVFATAVRNTLLLTVVGVIAGVLMGLGTAVLLNRPTRSARILRSGIFLPAVVPPVATAIIWLFILNPNYGLLNAILKVFGVGPVGWLADPAFSKYGLLMMVLWGGVGQIMMTFSAALQEIPQDIQQAASIDGAGRIASFRYITLPLLAPVLLYNVVIGTLFYFQFFEQAFVVSPTDLGAPANSTMTYALYIYQEAFTFLHMGTAAAMSVMLLIVSAAIIAIFFAVNRRLSR